MRTFRGKRFLVHRMRAAELDLPEPVDPGALFMHEDQLVLGAAQNTALVLEEVQLEGKPRMAGAAFCAGLQVKPGERVE